MIIALKGFVLISAGFAATAASAASQLNCVSPYNPSGATHEVTILDQDWNNGGVVVSGFASDGSGLKTQFGPVKAIQYPPGGTHISFFYEDDAGRSGRINVDSDASGQKRATSTVFPYSTAPMICGHVL